MQGTGLAQLICRHKRKRRGIVPAPPAFRVWENSRKHHIPNCTCRLLPCFRLRKRAIAQSGKNFG